MNAGSLRVLSFLAFIVACPTFAMSTRMAYRPASVDDVKVLIAKQEPVTVGFSGFQTLPVRSEPLHRRSVFKVFTTGYSQGTPVANLASGATVRLADVTEVPTLFGRQTWLEVEMSNGIKGWIPTSSLALLEGSDFGSPGLDLGVLSWWNTHYGLAESLGIGLLLVAFYFGVLVRQVVFKEFADRPLLHQLLLAIPISFVTVSSEVTAYTKVLPTGGSFPKAAAFLFALGLTMIQGILLPELSRKLIEKKMRRVARRASKVAGAAIASQSAAIPTPYGVADRPAKARRKTSRAARTAGVSGGPLEQLPNET